jgi:hypothetical protein
MRFSFFQSNKQSWGDLQARVSEILVYHLGSGKDFFVSFGNDKTPKQLRGFYRICNIIAPYMAESEGTFFDKDMVKQFVKQECNFCCLVKGRSITKSLVFADREKMTAMIKRLYELGEFYEAKDFKLTSAEKQSLVEYYEAKKE